MAAADQSGAGHLVTGPDKIISCPSNSLLDCSSFTTMDSIKYLWARLGLPDHAIQSVMLDHPDRHILPSSFKLGHLAQASITVSALAASLVDSAHNSTAMCPVSVSLAHCAVEFASERLFSLDGIPPEENWGPIGGLHKTADGYVRIHDNFLHHRLAVLGLLGLRENCARADVAAKVKEWKAVELEEAAMRNNAVVYALRSYKQWNALPQARAIETFPISIRRINDLGPVGFPLHMPANADRCLRGLRVLDFSRVIAAPVAGKTLAAHGADVLWVTAPANPYRSADMDVQRGKRTIQLDLESPTDYETLLGLIRDADVFLQSYRPGSFRRKGLSAETLAAMKPGIICANLSAWGDEGPWKENRGFDSMVQTASGMNASEAEHFDPYGETPAKAMPVQALDHAAGYLLATGIMAAMFERSRGGGSLEVTVSLTAVMKYLLSLGQLPGKKGFEEHTKVPEELVREDMFEVRTCGFGALKAINHSAKIEGKMPGWDVMPKEWGSDQATWL